MREVTIPLDDGAVLNARLHEGDSPTLILLHDLDCSSTYWEATITRLLQLDPTLSLVALDQRGHGRSTCGSETSRKRLVKDLKRAVKHLQLDDVVLCGHGWGADIALATDFASSVIAINPLFGREAARFDGDVPRPVDMQGAQSLAVLESCRIGAVNAKRLRRSRRDAPLMLIAAAPLDTQVADYAEFADAATECLAWQDASRHLPVESPAGVAALLLSWMEEVA